MSREEIFDYLDRYLKSMYDIMNTKTFECTMLKLRHIFYDDLEAYEKYVRIYNRLNFEEQKQVCINVCCSLVETLKKDMGEDKKTKVKIRE